MRKQSDDFIITVQKIPLCLSGGPLAQSAERGADTPGPLVLQLRRGREFEPLTDHR